MIKNPLVNAGERGSIPGLGISPGEGNGNPFQYSCLKNPMDGGAWWASPDTTPVQFSPSVAKSRPTLLRPRGL